MRAVHPPFAPSVLRADADRSPPHSRFTLRRQGRIHESRRERGGLDAHQRARRGGRELEQLGREDRPGRVAVDAVQFGAVQTAGAAGHDERPDAHPVGGHDHGQLRDVGRQQARAHARVDQVMCDDHRELRGVRRGLGEGHGGCRGSRAARQVDHRDSRVDAHAAQRGQQARIIASSYRVQHDARRRGRQVRVDPK